MEARRVEAAATRRAKRFADEAAAHLAGATGGAGTAIGTKGGAGLDASESKPAYVLKSSFSREEFAAWQLATADSYHAFLASNPSFVYKGF